jgi:putative transcriptional regulator
LIAGGGLFDPNFRQTVVLVADHNDEGALGVVLNRPAAVTVGEAAPVLTRMFDADDRLFVGGPVQPQAAVILAEFEHPELATKLVFDSIGIYSDADENGSVEGILRKRVFAGYAGWAPGQLDGELESGDWIVDSPSADDVFTHQPAELWNRVLKRKGGEYALLAQMPFDPSTN